MASWTTGSCPASIRSRCFCGDAGVGGWTEWGGGRRGGAAAGRDGYAGAYGSAMPNSWPTPGGQDRSHRRLCSPSIDNVAGGGGRAERRLDRRRGCRYETPLLLHSRSSLIQRGVSLAVVSGGAGSSNTLTGRTAASLNPRFLYVSGGPNDGAGWNQTFTSDACFCDLRWTDADGGIYHGWRLVTPTFRRSGRHRRQPHEARPAHRRLACRLGRRAESRLQSVLVHLLQCRGVHELPRHRCLSVALRLITDDGGTTPPDD